MGTKNQNENLSTTWMIDTSNDTYTLAKKAKITTDGEYAVDVVEGANNNDIVLLGDMMASNANAVVRILGNNTSLEIGEKASLLGATSNVGLLVGGTNFSLSNAGLVTGKSFGVSVTDYARIENSGNMLSAQVALAGDDGLDLRNSGLIDGNVTGIMTHADGTVIRNLAGGEIQSEGTAISLLGDGNAVIRNKGLIDGVTAIYDNEAATTVINTGEIKGWVNLGAGDDVFNTRKGTFGGMVSGGDGDDTYIISKSNIQIEELLGFGYDTVKSTVSFTLGDYLEDLKLLGAKNANATGNEENNVLTGNKGENILSGMGGSDYLIGGKGDDTLLGGAGQDLFDFRKGTGDDVVEDFVNGEDVIFTPFANDGPEIADLIANHAVEKNGGVMISYGEDSLFLKGMTMEQLDASDFFSGL